MWLLRNDSCLSERKSHGENIVIDFIILNVTDTLSNFSCIWCHVLKCLLIMENRSRESLFKILS